MAIFVPKDRRSLFRQFLSGMYDAVVITDPNGYILEINQRAIEHFGYEQDEVLDKPISLYIPSFTEEVVPRVRRGLSEDRHVVINANAKNRAGERMAVEVAVSTIDLMTPDDMVFTIRNVERRRKLMTSLRSKENAFELATDGLFVCDAEGKFLEANAAFRELFGLEAEETVGDYSFDDFLNDDPLPENFRKALAGETTVVELVAENDEAESESLRITLAPNNLGGKLVGVIGSVSKICG